MWNVTFFLIVVSLGLSLRLGTYVVYEGTQAIVTQFGAIIGAPATEPGLYFRIPLLQKVHVLDTRIETWKGFIDYIPTKDRQFVAVESVAHWRVNDPIVFLEQLGSKELAESRLDSLLIGSVKDMVSTHSLVDTVRNSNRIVNERMQAGDDVQAGSAHLKALEDQLKNSITSSLEVVTVGREHLTRKMFTESAFELRKLGIELLGIYISKVSYEPKVEQTVYARMTSERMRVAERLLSIGRSERERILGQLSKDSADLLAPAVRDAEILMGKADAEALAIYAEAYNEDPEFYSFWRSIQAYRKSLSGDTTIVTSTQSNYYRSLFEDPNAGFRTQTRALNASVVETVGIQKTDVEATKVATGSVTTVEATDTGANVEDQLTPGPLGLGASGATRSSSPEPLSTQNLDAADEVNALGSQEE